MTLVAALVTALQPWPVKILVDYALGEGVIPGKLVEAQGVYRWNRLHPCLSLWRREPAWRSLG